MRPVDVILRPYQERAMAQILGYKDRGINRVIVVMPTGTGKTTLFSALIGRYRRDYGLNSLVLAHRRELLDQAARRIAQQNPNVSVAVEGAGSRLTKMPEVVVGSVQSLGRSSGESRLEGFTPGAMIIDEAHHAAADGYQTVMRRFGCYEGTCFTVGVTATPHRMDNQPLHGDEEAIFQEVAFTYTLRDAIADGWLADLKGYRVATNVDLSRVRMVHGDYSAKALQNAVNTQARNETAFENWSNVAADRRTIAFCTGIEHAETVAELFRARGIAAESVNGKMSAEVREGIMRRFVTGRTQVLTNVEIATEGFDVPDIGCVLLLRPTKSWALFCQMIGRGLRVLPNTIEGLPDADARRIAIKGSPKADCIVIDVVDAGRRAPRAEEADPSVTAIIGLPADLDLEGHSLLDALQQWDQLDPRLQAAMFKRELNFDALSDTLTAVDLLAELTLPEEVVESSGNAWMKVGDGLYLLPCGNSASEGARMAALEEDALGNYHLKLSSGVKDARYFECGRDQREVFARADRYIKEVWPFTAGFTRANVAWRKQAPTEEQRAELVRLGLDRAIVDMIDSAGHAWTLIQLRRDEAAKG